jgi:hypothetical protein
MLGDGRRRRRRRRRRNKANGFGIEHLLMFALVPVLLILMILIMLCVLLGHPSLPSRGDPLAFLRGSEVWFLLLSCFLCAFFVQKNREIPK